MVVLAASYLKSNYQNLSVFLITISFGAMCAFSLSLSFYTESQNFARAMFISSALLSSLPQSCKRVREVLHSWIKESVLRYTRMEPASVLASGLKRRSFNHLGSNFPVYY